MHTPPNRLALAGIALVALAALAGCVTLEIAVTVSDDGTIDEYVLDMEMDAWAHDLLDQQAQSEGYDSFADSFLAEYEASEQEGIGDANYEEEERDGDRKAVIITLEDVDPNASAPLSIDVTEDGVTYEDLTLSEEGAGDIDEEVGDTGEFGSIEMTIRYTLTMPGDIVNSTAHEVDGNTATWEWTSSNSSDEMRVYAESERASSGGIGGIPGFGLGVAALAIAAVAALAIRRQG